MTPPKSPRAAESQDTDKLRAELAAEKAAHKRAQIELADLRMKYAATNSGFNKLGDQLHASIASGLELERHLENATAELIELRAKAAMPQRRKLDKERQSVTHHFVIRAGDGTYDGYLIVGLYSNGDVGEIFLRLAKQGSDISGFADQWAIAFSMLLQLGYPLEDLCKKFVGTSFEPAGATDTPGIRLARSPVDYICRMLLRRYVEKKPFADE